MTREEELEQQLEQAEKECQQAYNTLADIEEVCRSVHQNWPLPVPHEIYAKACKVICKEPVDAKILRTKEK